MCVHVCVRACVCACVCVCVLLAECIHAHVWHLSVTHVRTLHAEAYTHTYKATQSISLNCVMHAVCQPGAVHANRCMSSCSAQPGTVPGGGPQCRLAEE